MSWLFSQALVAAYLPDTPLDGAPCALWKTTPIPRRSWLPVKMKASCILAQSGMTYRPLTDDRGAALLTSFLAAFLAKTYPQPVAETDSTEPNLDSGSKWPESFAKFDHATSSWKTAQNFEPRGSTVSSRTWPAWGTMQGGACYRLKTPVRHIGDPVCGSAQLWPTPVASEGKDCGSTWAALAKLDRGGRLQRRMATLGLPETLRTPKATLNPAWSEWLMGWPIGWTDLEPLAMDKFRAWQHAHGISSVDDA